MCEAQDIGMTFKMLIMSHLEALVATDILDLNIGDNVVQNLDYVNPQQANK